jgi:hypothetical protein
MEVRICEINFILLIFISKTKLKINKHLQIKHAEVQKFCYYFLFIEVNLNAYIFKYLIKIFPCNEWMKNKLQGGSRQNCDVHSFGVINKIVVIYNIAVDWWLYFWTEVKIVIFNISKEFSEKNNFDATNQAILLRL